MKLATLDELKHHLRYDGDDDDVMLSSYLAASEQLVKSYITDKITDEMLPVLKVATLLMAGYLDDNRNSERGEAFGNYLPAAVRQLLAPYRMPTV